MATPVLEGLKAAAADMQVSFLVEEGFEAGIENNPHCDRVIRLPRKTIRNALRSSRPAEGLALLRQFVAEVGATPYDALVNLSQHPYLSYLLSLLPARGHCGRRYLREGNHAVDDPWSRYLYCVPYARKYNRLHAVDVYRRIAGVSVHRGGYTVNLDQTEVEAAARRLRENGIDPEADRIIVFQPGAAYPAKRWPAQNFVILGKWLREDGWRIVVSGAPAERETAASIALAIGEGCYCAAGSTTFREAIAMLAHARGCVTPDTAIMHAAAALDVPVYALFGATSPVETGPYGKGHWLFSSYCNDRPCFCTTCKSMLCMKSISPQTVFSCITKGTVGDAPHCDVYRTSLQPNGDYRLRAVSPNAYRYYGEAGAAITLEAFGGPEERSDLDHDEAALCREESREFVAILSAMRKDLEGFLTDRDPAAVRRFESTKSSFARFKGIGAFWYALFNIALNGVPLLDVVQGIRTTVERCKELESVIGRVADGAKG